MKHLLLSSVIALINPIEGSLQYKTTDITLGHFSLKRIYSSRSFYNGYFGFGWCSNLDVHLDVAKQTLQICQYQSKVQILKLNHQYQVQVSKNIRYHFNLSGQLSKVYKNGNQLFELKYANKELTLIIDNKTKQSLEVVSLKNKIIRLRKKKTMIANYEYFGPLLSKAKSEAYTYDNLDNLTAVAISGKKKLTIAYDEKNDLVEKIEANSACTSLFSYSTTQTLEKIFSVTTEKTFCPDLATKITYHKFEYQKNTANQVHLVKSSKGEIYENHKRMPSDSQPGSSRHAAQPAIKLGTEANSNP